MASDDAFVFNSENFQNPELPLGLDVVDVSIIEATDENLKGYGKILNGPDEISCENKNFEIVAWPVSGWRKLDPQTGDEAGTTEGNFEVHWQGDYFYGKNLTIATEVSLILSQVKKKKTHVNLTLLKV